MLDIERALKARCAEDAQYERLWAQWTFDRQLVGRALGAVATTFPHYSLHDASHSDTILRQIARVLGPRRIALLGATDLWLLLEAAYHHDVGMVLTEEDQRRWWSSPEAAARLDQLADGPDVDLAQAAQLLLAGALPSDRAG